MSPLSLAGAAQAAHQRLDVILFTVTVLTPDGTEISRVYSSHPDTYAIGGRKRTDPSYTSPIWFEQVISAQRAFVGRDRDSVREFFRDWETIESLGCGSIVNTPVVLDGVTIGSINFLGPEGSLDQSSLALALDITAAVTAAVSDARRDAFPELAA
jgi:hypothetical protein